LFILVVGVAVLVNNYMLMKREHRRTRDLQMAMHAEPPAGAGRPAPDI